MHDAPQHIVSNALVLMAQHIAYPATFDHGFPVPGFQLVAQMPARLGDDLNAALDSPTLAFVGFQILELHACDLAAEQLDRLDDVGEARNRRRATIRISAAPRPRSLAQTGCKLRRVMMSVFVPNDPGGRLLTSINAKARETLGMVKEEIDIGVFACLTPRRRAEQVEVLDAEPLQLGSFRLSLAITSLRSIGGLSEPT